MSSQYGLYELGYTRATKAGTKGNKNVNFSKSQKSCLSSNCSLEVENMKVESLVIVDQNVTVNKYSSLVHTARHDMGVDLAASCRIIKTLFF